MNSCIENKDLTNILHHCIEDINNSELKLNHLIDKRFQFSKKVYLCNSLNYIACCRKQRKDSSMKIYYSKRFLDLSQTSKKNVIMHELIHTFSKSMNHDADYIEHMNYINRNLNYDVTVEYIPQSKQDKIAYLQALSYGRDVNVFFQKNSLETEVKSYVELFCSTLKGKIKITKFTTLVKESIQHQNIDKIMLLNQLYPTAFQNCLKYLTKEERTFL